MIKSKAWLCYLYIFIFCLIIVSIGTIFLKNNKNNKKVDIDEIQEVSTSSKINTPGWCLVFDNDNCALGHPYYDKENRLTSVGFDLKEGAYVYSPLDADVYVDEVVLNSGRKLLSVIIGSNYSFDKVGDLKLAYHFTVDGVLMEGIKSESKVSKGQVLLRVNGPKTDKKNVYLRIFEGLLNENNQIVEKNNIEKMQKLINKEK